MSYDTPKTFHVVLRFLKDSYLFVLGHFTIVLRIMYLSQDIAIVLRIRKDSFMQLVFQDIDKTLLFTYDLWKTVQYF